MSLSARAHMRYMRPQRGRCVVWVGLSLLCFLAVLVSVSQGLRESGQPNSPSPAPTTEGTDASARPSQTASSSLRRGSRSSKTKVASGGVNAPPDAVRGAGGGTVVDGFTDALSVKAGLEHAGIDPTHPSMEAVAKSSGVPSPSPSDVPVAGSAGSQDAARPSVSLKPPVRRTAKKSASSTAPSSKAGGSNSERTVETPRPVAAADGDSGAVTYIDADSGLVEATSSSLSSASVSAATAVGETKASLASRVDATGTGDLLGAKSASPPARASDTETVASTTIASGTKATSVDASDDIPNASSTDRAQHSAQPTSDARVGSKTRSRRTTTTATAAPVADSRIASAMAYMVAGNGLPNTKVAGSAMPNKVADRPVAPSVPPSTPSSGGSLGGRSVGSPPNSVDLGAALLQPQSPEKLTRSTLSTSPVDDANKVEEKNTDAGISSEAVFVDANIETSAHFEEDEDAAATGNSGVFELDANKDTLHENVRGQKARRSRGSVLDASAQGEVGVSRDQGALAPANQVSAVSMSVNAVSLEEASPLLYVETLDGKMHAVESGTGAVRWSLNLGPLLESSPVAPGSSDKFFIPSPRDGVLFVCDPQDNNNLIRFPKTIPELVETAPFRSQEGLFMGLKTTSILAIDPIAGRVIKRYQPTLAADDEDSFPSLPPGTIFVGRTVYNLTIQFTDRTKPKWHVTYAQYLPSVTNGKDYKRIQSLGNTVFFAGVNNGTLTARDKTSGELRWSVRFQSTPMSLFAVRDEQTARLAFVPLLNDFDGPDDATNGDAFVRRQFGGDGFRIPATLSPHVLIGVHEGALYAQMVLRNAAEGHALRGRDGLPLISDGGQRIPAGKDGRDVTDVAIVGGHDPSLHYDALTCERVSLNCDARGGGDGLSDGAGAAEACVPGSPNFPFCLVGVHEVPSVGLSIIPEIHSSETTPSIPSDHTIRLPSTGDGRPRDDIADVDRKSDAEAQKIPAAPVTHTTVLTVGAATATVIAVMVVAYMSRGRPTPSPTPLKGSSAVENISAVGMQNSALSPSKPRKKKTKKKASSKSAIASTPGAPDADMDSADHSDPDVDAVVVTAAGNSGGANDAAWPSSPAPPSPVRPATTPLPKAPAGDSLRVESAASMENNASESGSRTDVPVQLFSGGTFSEPVHHSDGTYTLGRLRVSGTVLGHGCHGTVVLKGDYEGRPVAVKRMLAEWFDLATREIDLLQKSDAHPHVIRYYCREQDSRFLYIALELCAMTLVQWVEEQAKPADRRSEALAIHTKHPLDARRLLMEVMDGLAHLHSIGVVHRDLKPQNVLLTSRGRALISDFGLCKLLVDGQSSYHTNVVAGTVGWTAPEMLREARTTRAVDIFSAGCLVFYAVTGGRHPFGEHYERELNIRNGKSDLHLLAHDPETSDLVGSMICDSASMRPSAPDALRHPFFWAPARRLHFLMEFSDRIEKEDALSPLVTALEHAGASVVGEDWRTRLEPELLADMGKFRKYNWASVRDLLRAMRNKKHHYRELNESLRLSLGEVPDGFYGYFNSRFPLLLMRTYGIVRSGPCKDERMFEPYFASAAGHSIVG